MPEYIVGVSFTTPNGDRPPLFQAIEALRSMTLEATTSELAEHYAQQIIHALEQQAG
jgi:hypothetical protein